MIVCFMNLLNRALTVQKRGGHRRNQAHATQLWQCSWQLLVRQAICIRDCEGQSSYCEFVCIHALHSINELYSSLSLTKTLSTVGLTLLAPCQTCPRVNHPLKRLQVAHTTNRRTAALRDLPETRLHLRPQHPSPTASSHTTYLPPILP